MSAWRSRRPRRAAATRTGRVEPLFYGAVILPLLLIVIGLLTAAGLAYGCSSYWSQFARGEQIIMLARQLQWPLVMLSLSAAGALILLVIAGKRRAWWLIGLAPILALFAHRFATGPASAMTVLENPPMLNAAAAAGVRDDDYVVGVEFNGKTLAFPYACLYSAPVIVHQERDKRFMLIWSAAANRALAFTIEREIKVREVEPVSVAGDALLVYNARYGQFINGVTGRTPAGEKPLGFGRPVPTWKMPWSRWRQLHADTQVLALNPPANAPRGPIVPFARTSAAPRAAIVVGVDHPILVSPGDLDLGQPLNLSADGIPVVVWRDPRTGLARAFDRRIDDQDLIPRFTKNSDGGRRVAAQFVDSDAGCGWSAEGVAVDGDKQFRGKRLESVPIEEDVYAVAVQHWFSGTTTYDPSPAAGDSK